MNYSISFHMTNIIEKGSIMRLIIISNRLPITITPDGLVLPSIGGVATGLNAFLQNYISASNNEYLWLGSPGLNIADEVLCTAKVQAQLVKMSCKPIVLDNGLMQKFYTGFCNNTIWPTFLNLTAYYDYNEEDWQIYQQVNKEYASVISQLIKPGDIIWIHDYHFLLLAWHLKSMHPEIAVGLFLHIPFPSFDTFQFLPNKCRKDILKGMLGADLIGFHTYEYAQNFITRVRWLEIDNVLIELKF